MKSRTRLWTTLLGYSKTVTYSRNVYIFGGGLTAADLSRVRAEKKQKEKEAKEKNDRETGHGDSLETDACDVGEATKTTLRTLLLALLNQNIEDVVLEVINEQRAVCMISNSTSAAELNLEKEYEEVGAEGGDDEDDKEALHQDPRSKPSRAGRTDGGGGARGVPSSLSKSFE
ncbi:hypothetical protein F2Q69_00041141 [Brassica cretica]|uniref:Uncharacterized protein n=1 Tax=Brassica cretica TaxID=69181 RepID=A0A8S9NFJ2_BRACR|nr:hypothetical protein F2Q69_00041141 [Brassica cretica]